MSPIPTHTIKSIIERQTPRELIQSSRRSWPTYTATIPFSTYMASSSARIFHRSTDPNTPNTGVVIAAVLSSILGTLVLLTVLYKCCINNRSAAYIPPAYISHSSSSFSCDDNSGGVRGRGGGLPRHYHHGVCRPEIARTRVRPGCARRNEVISVSRHRSRHREGHGRRSRAVMGSRDGMLGWFWMPNTEYGYRDRRYGWPRGSGYSDCIDD